MSVHLTQNLGLLRVMPVIYQPVILAAAEVSDGHAVSDEKHGVIFSVSLTCSAQRHSHDFGSHSSLC